MTSNSFYASFKIYIHQLRSAPQPRSKTPAAANSGPQKIVRIEQVEDVDDQVFLDSPQNVEFQIKVDPAPITPPPTGSRQGSPVFYLEPDDWGEDQGPTPMPLASPTRALSPCQGCGKCHAPGFSAVTPMESLPEENSRLMLPIPRAAMVSELGQPAPRQRKVTIPVWNSRSQNSSRVRSVTR